MTRFFGRGARAPAQPLPIEFANSIYLQAGTLHDMIATPEGFGTWAGDVENLLVMPVRTADLESLTPVELAKTRELRDAIRLLLRTAVAHRPLDPLSINTVSRYARTHVRRAELRNIRRSRTRRGESSTVMTEIRAQIAWAAIDLLSGPQRNNIRTCGRYDCADIFLKSGRYRGPGNIAREFEGAAL